MTQPAIVANFPQNLSLCKKKKNLPKIYNWPSLDWETAKSILNTLTAESDRADVVRSQNHRMVKDCLDW